MFKNDGIKLEVIASRCHAHELAPRILYTVWSKNAGMKQKKLAQEFSSAFFLCLR